MSDPERYLVVQISDTHLVVGDELKPGVRPRENLERALGRLEASGIRPDVLLLTGDLTDRGDHASYVDLHGAVTPFANRVGATVVALPGNHDTRPGLRTGLLGGEAVSDPVYQVTWVRGLRIVALDTSIPGEVHGALDDGQLAALRDELATPAPTGTLVALHHPPIPSPLPLMNAYGLREPERLAAVLEGSDVLMIVAGHDHHASCGSLGGIPVWVAPACAYQLDPLATGDRLETLVGLEGSAFARIDIVDRRAVATLVPVSGGFAPLAPGC